MSKRQINKAKGYRIHLDTLKHSELLLTFAQAYKGRPEAKSVWFLNRADLKDRETRTVKNAADLLSMMQNSDPERLEDSVVLFGTQEPISWKNFFAEDEAGLTDLYNRASRATKQNPIPCAILFETSETTTIREGKDKQSIIGQTIDEDGRDIDVELNFPYIRSRHLSDFTIPKGQLILATGMARRLYVNDKEILRVNVEDEKAWALLSSREELTVAPPPIPVQPYILTYEKLGRLD